MKRYWPIAVVVLGFAALGVANALKAPAGQSRADLETQARLNGLSTSFAGWTGEDVPVPDRELRVAQAQAHLSRVYSHEGGGAKISTLLLFGEPGQLGAHTPQVCFAGAGYEQVARESKVPVGPDAEFWAARFESGTFQKRTLQVIWGWGVDGVWKASDTARLDFAGHGRIFKLYVSRLVPPAADGGADDPVPAFTAAYLRELRDALNRTPSPANGSPAK